MKDYGGYGREKGLRKDNKNRADSLEQLFVKEGRNFEENKVWG